jgi:riboflavin kinase/FMN adenylyltransferase
VGRLAGEAGTQADDSVRSVAEKDQVAEVVGVVVRGDGRGRQLGFPTANVSVAPGSVLPPDGIYAGWLERSSAAPDQGLLPAAVSIGTRPTYYEDGEAERLVEAYVLDFDGDLYGESVRLVVGERVRGQVRFESEADLVAQMDSDVEAVRERARSGPSVSA